MRLSRGSRWSSVCSQVLPRRFQEANLAGRFADPSKASDDLAKFAKLNEQRLYKLLRTLMDPEIDLKTLLKTYAEARRRIADASSSQVDTFDSFINRSAFLVISQSMIPPLLQHISEPSSPGAITAAAASTLSKELLFQIAKGTPSMFKAYVDLLVSGLGNEANGELVDVSLLALASLARSDASSLPTDRYVPRDGLQLTYPDA